ncbi:SRPBCC family protein [Urechidicola vernalis]|uniref:SRPBCC domain-containing protein n=1 Tax=Urechidicola vernalis TaxID=3075600 RepID=A0ABU2Y277_9FLAO|nr:SRPBCC domain-containing protein [Urechidicola sp. P050]MDT0552309.1 SRPBCC domain-containing protein [Urechidicola sp. P050]
MSSKHSIYHDLVVDATINKVFNVISNPNELMYWWPLKCQGVPELNNTYNFYFSEEFNWFGKVVSIEKNKQFFIKMTTADSDWVDTTFGFELIKNGNSTQLSFSHLNWSKCNTHFKTSSFCWAMLLNGLKNYVEKGIIIPFEERT